MFKKKLFIVYYMVAVGRKSKGKNLVWTYIRLRKPTAIRLRILKAELGSEMYDDVLNILMDKFQKLNKNEKNKHK